VIPAERKKQELTKLAEEVIASLEDEELREFLRWIHRVNLASEGFLDDETLDVLHDVAEMGLFHFEEYRKAVFFLLQMSMNDPLRIAFVRGWHAQRPTHGPVDLSQIEVHPFRPRPGRRGPQGGAHGRVGGDEHGQEENQV